MSNEFKNQIRTPVWHGALVAERNPDPDYDGITVYFETDEGDIVDVVLVESKKENEYKQTDIYTYEDAWDEGYQHKFSINTEDIEDALNSDN